MVVTFAKRDGTKQSIVLDRARGDGVGVQITAPAGYVEQLPLDRVTGLELDADETNPGLNVSMGQYMRVFPLDPSSRLIVGYEDPATPDLMNKQRQEQLVVGELAAVDLDLTTSTVPVKEVA